MAGRTAQKGDSLPGVTHIDDVSDPPNDLGNQPGDLLDRIDHYQDALPRLDSRAEDFGPLTLFVRDDGPPLHARPTRGWQGRTVTAADVDRVRASCARLPWGPG